MGFGFPVQNVGEIVLLYPVYISYKQVNQRNNWHLFSSAIILPCMPGLIKSPMMCELFHLRVFRFEVFYSMTILFSQRNCQLLAIHDWVVHLTRTGKFWEYMFPSHLIYSLGPSIKYLRQITVMHLLFPNFISTVMPMKPWQP